MKKFILFLVLFSICSFYLNHQSVFGQENNKFGLHLTQTGDIDEASKIINSSGGDWGYVTIVIRLDQLNHQTWQEFFDKCRQKHLIPIVRLATIMNQGSWKRPVASDIDTLANFLHDLNWPTTNQYVILFNEINHGSEWGGGVDINSYVDLAIYSHQKFKLLNQNFMILSGGLDLAAPTKNKEFKSAGDTYREIYNYNPNYFENIDAIASHSYPNHGYIGLPSDTGQHSIKGYDWELKFIHNLGISKTFPVFITETGWPHREGILNDNKFYTASTAAKLFLNALNIWQIDNRVKAVTPFIYNYPNQPFDHFSWLDQNEALIPAYQKIVELPKFKNTPLQTTNYELISNHLPFILLTNTEYLGEVLIKNTGQSIWGETNFCLTPDSTINVTIDQLCTSNEFIYPGQLGKFYYKISIKNMPEYKEKTFISWQNLPPLEITPLNGYGTIYSPKTTWRQKIVQYFQSWFI